MRVLCRITVVCVLLLLVLSLSDARRRKKHSKAMVLRQKETNAVNFIRLSVMRLIYGIATRIGLGEQISEALNGAFVPPGAEDYDYDREGFGLLGDDDDYDY
ncbi:uncharacterized protein LOC108906497 [Anoplophora glabripennis]|uniref:uncharacterized protein LOC108906497 n=1 Tax=Anoplophora glabripennis TaxID=217634 RepID=UPI00087586E1|nr:uncharacterized protein LOC108906497 [Anoplophora glabripennis]